MADQAEKPLSGRVALVTGANTGIGFITARELAKQGAQVFIACRSEERARSALDRLRQEAGPGAGSFDGLALDLGDPGSVKKCAADFLAKKTPLHLLINNAGLAGSRGISKSGFEVAFGVNHVGHFLLTSLLLDRLKSSAPARIVTVASKAHYRAPGIDYAAARKTTASRTGLPEYGVAKLANVLFSAALSRRLAGTGVSTYSLHPGVVATDVWRSVPGLLRPLIKAFMLSPEDGAKTTLYCATSAEAGDQTGLYYDSCKFVVPGLAAQDPAKAEELFTRSEAWAKEL